MESCLKDGFLGDGLGFALFGIWLLGYWGILGILGGGGGKIKK